MKPTAYDFKEFYSTPMGSVVAQAVSGAIARFWPDMKGRHVLVYGFGMPYLPVFEGAERLTFLMPPDQGGYVWPEEGGNLVAISARTMLPIESNTLDGVVLIHSLEFTNAVEPHLQEIWRVLKSNGRLIVVVPNRLGFWSRVDWAPFGQGTPFSVFQIHRYLRETLFIPERVAPVLFALPLRARLLMRVAGMLEKYGAYVLPGLSGLHVVEASKQVYAGLLAPATARAARLRVREEEVLVPTPPASHTPHP